MANLIYNLFGFLPAPYVYGAIYDAGEGGNGRIAMGTLMVMPIFCTIFLVSAKYIIVKDNILNYSEHSSSSSE
jgi:hypothetical protein